MVCHFILLSHPAAVILHPFVAVCLKPQQFVDQPSCVLSLHPSGAIRYPTVVVFTSLHYVVSRYHRCSSVECSWSCISFKCFLQGAPQQVCLHPTPRIPPPASLCNHFTSPWCSWGSVPLLYDFKIIFHSFVPILHPSGCICLVLYDLFFIRLTAVILNELDSVRRVSPSISWTLCLHHLIHASNQEGLKLYLPQRYFTSGWLQTLSYWEHSYVCFHMICSGLKKLKNKYSKRMWVAVFASLDGWIIILVTFKKNPQRFVWFSFLSVNIWYFSFLWI